MWMLVIGWLLGVLTVCLWEIRARRQRWRVQRVIRTDENNRPHAVFFVKGGESAKVWTVGFNRAKTQNPDTSFDDAMTEGVVEARVLRDVLNATDRNLQRHG